MFLPFGAVVPREPYYVITKKILNENIFFWKNKMQNIKLNDYNTKVALNYLTEGCAFPVI